MNKSDKELADLLNKCWMTHDGMWFFHCLQEFGIRAANKINKAAIQSLAPIEIGRFKNAFGYQKTIDNYEEFKQFFTAVADIVISDFMNVTFQFPGQNIMTWSFDKGKCFAYKGIKRAGAIDEYECGVLYRIHCWLKELEIENTFSPTIGNCLMHLKGKCAGHINLFF